MDDEEFIQFLVKEGYAEPEARALVGQVYDDDSEIAPEGFFDIRTRDGSTVEVEVDGSMGFAGVLRFIVTGEPSREQRREIELREANARIAELGRHNGQLAARLAESEAELSQLRSGPDGSGPAT